MSLNNTPLRTSIEGWLQRAGLLPAARGIAARLQWCTQPMLRQRQRARSRQFQRFQRAYRGILHHHLNGFEGRRPRVLLASHSASKVEVQLGFAKALEMAGFELVAVNIQEEKLVRSYCREYYGLAGVRAFHSMSEFLRRPDLREAEALLAQCQSLEELLALEQQGVRLGRLAVSTAMRQLHRGSFDMASPSDRRLLVPYVASAMQVANATRCVLERFQPQAVLLMDNVYTPEGVVFDVCLQRGIDTITWALGHQSSTLMLKRYVLATRDQHPKSLSDETWQLVRQMPWTEGHRQRLHEELYGSYASGDWQSHVGTQFDKRFAEADEVRRQLGLDPAKKTAVIFPHILWDASLSWGKDLFANYEEWLVETVRAACQNPQVNWIVKIHPAHVGKNLKEGRHGEPTEVAVLSQRVGTLPSHIRFLPADHPLNTFSLYSVIDYCVTVRGTVGIEAARLGIPVLNGGTGRYSGKGFTLDPASREAYLHQIAHLHEVPRLTPAQQELAERFAYGTFLLRPLRLRTMTLEYRKEYLTFGESRNYQTDFRIVTGDDWHRAADLQAFARWVADGKQTDFIMPVDGGTRA